MTARVPLQAHLDLTPPRRRASLPPPDTLRREGKEPVLDVVARREQLAALAPAAVAVAASAGEMSPVQALNKAAAAETLDGTEAVKLRVPKAVAAAVEANPAAAALALETKGAAELKVDVEAFLGYTAWFTSPPPWCAGFFEVRQKAARLSTKHLRMWYVPEHNWWLRSRPVEGAPHDDVPIPHAQLVLSHFWRGLAAPWPAYTYRVPGQRVFLKE